MEGDEIAEAEAITGGGRRDVVGGRRSAGWVGFGPFGGGG